MADSYTVVTPSRIIPFDCGNCASRTCECFHAAADFARSLVARGESDEVKVMSPADELLMVVGSKAKPPSSPRRK